MEAAARVDELPHSDLARLLVKAAIRLRLAENNTRLEHIPVSAYHLLRRLSREAVPLESLFGREDKGLIDFLVTRKLASHGTDGASLLITPEGEELGTIADERRFPRTGG
jgi:hypothetical protein